MRARRPHIQGMTRSAAIPILIVAVLTAFAAQAQVVVPLPVVPRPPSNTDGLVQQRNTLNRLLEDQTRTRALDQKQLQQAGKRRDMADRERQRQLRERSDDLLPDGSPANHP